MFEQPGIGLDDLAWIQRDEFVHYLTLAHELGRPADWQSFRQDLLAAVAAAFGLDLRSGAGDASRRQATLDLLDRLCGEYDPHDRWPAFLEALWERRRAIRADL